MALKNKLVETAFEIQGSVTGHCSREVIKTQQKKTAMGNRESNGEFRGTDEDMERNRMASGSLRDLLLNLRRVIHSAGCEADVVPRDRPADGRIIGYEGIRTVVVANSRRHRP
ncbi:uncharacterized protein G6M90_00g062480 [Metarhizium brunneum]|uniref:Uncharacterized protein n=1 Tax=Metarhizium brunneum TaxID=500148 RepID=A0A7D5YYK1_9HYPO|nr:hypothetical protein G6M90_00g062480 [Metarhizium brunneum]